MSDDGFAGLIVQSAKVRTEHRLLLEELNSLEQRLVELVGGLGCGGKSKTICLEEHTDDDGDVVGHIDGYLGFDGNSLFVSAKDEPRRSLDYPYWSIYKLDSIGADWQRLVSSSDVLKTLLEDIEGNLKKEFEKTAPVVNSLSQFAAVEKAKIDTDIDDFFNPHAAIFESWLKARKSVVTDPEISITLSCSHLETVLKKCLNMMGEVGYEKEPIERLYKATLKKLLDLSAVDPATSQMLRGVGTICHGVGTIRNDKSASHGKDENYAVPSRELAQTVNHLAGVVSVFLMRQTTLILNKK